MIIKGGMPYGWFSRCIALLDIFFPGIYNNTVSWRIFCPVTRKKIVVDAFNIEFISNRCGGDSILIEFISNRCGVDSILIEFISNRCDVDSILIEFISNRCDVDSILIEFISNRCDVDSILIEFISNLCGVDSIWIKWGSWGMNPSTCRSEDRCLESRAYFHKNHTIDYIYPPLDNIDCPQ